MARFPWKRRLATGETAEEALETLYYEARTDQEMASLLSVVVGQKVSMVAVRQKRQNLGLGKGLGGVPLIRPSTAPPYDQPPQIEGDTLVMCDLHVPFHDAPWCNRVIGLALTWDVKNLVLGGDILDLVTLRHFAPHFTKSKDEKKKVPTSLEDELIEAGEVFDALAAFEKVLYISGGHELRLLRKLDRTIAISRFAAMFTDLPQLEMSAYHKCDIGQDWHISHPRSTSVIPGRVPFFLVRKYRKNVGIGHDHVWGMVQNDSGENVAISIGVCCDPTRLDYVALQDTTRPAVSQGALIIKRNKPWLLSPKWSDFAALRSIRF